MKQLVLILILSLASYSSSRFTYSKSEKSESYPAACSSKELIKETKELLKLDFIYDGFKVIKVKLKDKPQIKRMVLPLSQDVKFKYVFNRKYLPKGSEIKVYYGNEIDDDKMLFSSSTFNVAEDLLVYEPAKEIRLLTIEFKIPAAGEGGNAGCVCILAGYKL